MPGLAPISEGSTTAKPVDEAPKIHEENPDFDRDRFLRNSEFFLTDFGCLWIFKFAGSSHQNYMAYPLEVYCLLRYEASKDLKNAILNNWLVCITGELGKWLPRDLHQEHYNRWLEDMVQKHGGEFDNKFYRLTISSNVHHFLRIKEEIETAFSLKHRGKTHTSPHLRDELQLLLTMFKAVTQNSQHFLVALVIMYQPLITSNPALKIVKERRATTDQNENCARHNAMTVP
ncbi:hypothetical protein B0H14DRAFT_2646904 [Mycena olivaceomarginata]|nr:hypothetical protein B0H14DRAFT_2646904 [Mycena olivaceomarginata]